MLWLILAVAWLGCGVVAYCCHVYQMRHEYGPDGWTVGYRWELLPRVLTGPFLLLEVLSTYLGEFCGKRGLGDKRESNMSENERMTAMQTILMEQCGKWINDAQTQIGLRYDLWLADIPTPDPHAQNVVFVVRRIQDGETAKFNLPGGDFRDGVGKALTAIAGMPAPVWSEFRYGGKLVVDSGKVNQCT